MTMCSFTFAPHWFVKTSIIITPLLLLVHGWLNMVVAEAFPWNSLSNGLLTVIWELSL